MHVRPYARLYLLSLVGTLCISVGCQKESAPPPPSLVIDTSLCLGAASQPGASITAPVKSCRQQISRPSPDGVATGCFIFESLGQVRVVPTMWIDDRVEILPGQDSLVLETNNLITVSFFGFKSPQAQADAQCSSMDVRSQCEGLPGCLVKLGPQSAQPASGQEVVFDFNQPELGCLIETSAEVSGQPEVCDGYDNDCDGRFDESDPFAGDSCTFDVTETCRRTGTEVCEDGIRTCRIEEQQDLCNQKDDDCDGTIDEDEACPDCNVDSDCPNDLYCRDRSCFECLENSHCPSSQPVCIDNQCSPCSDTAQCPDGLVCDVSGGRCGVCSTTTNEGFCSMGLVCDSSSLTCKPCGADDVVCPNNRLCINDTCGECDPNDDSNRACGVGLICADDRDQNLGYRCRPCDLNASPDECPTDDKPRCVLGLANGPNTCEACSPIALVGSNGCAARVPICVTDAGGVRCVGCNDGTTPDQPPHLCGPDATCINGRCEGCSPQESADSPPSSCPSESPICASSGGAFSCGACTTDAQCRTQFFDKPDKDTCKNGRCVDCNANAGCDTESTQPICNNETCVGCTSDSQCSDLSLGDGRNFCVNTGSNTGKCESCIPGTSKGCGRMRCSDTFQCESCDEEDYCGGVLFPDAPVCVAGMCEACDDQADIGENRCPRTTPVCDGNPLACSQCDNDNECGVLQCDDNGQCVVCSTTSYVDEIIGGSAVVAAHTGCDSDPYTPICDGGACRACALDADCPVGECTLFGNGVTQKRCRIATEQSCTSRRLGFDAGRQSCTSCIRDDCRPSLPCSTTPQTFDTGAQISKCGGCESDNNCNGNSPFCNEVNASGEVEDVGQPRWVCRDCVDNDCVADADGDPTYCSQSDGNCHACIDTQNGVNTDLGCTNSAPKCQNHECVE